MAVADVMRHVQDGIDRGEIRDGDPTCSPTPSSGSPPTWPAVFVHEQGQPGDDVADAAVAFCLEGLLVPSAITPA